MGNLNSRDKLICATQELIWERGLNDISPKQIQERADVGHGSMYHHFSSKNELALAAIEKTVDEFIVKLDELCGSRMSAYEKISHFMLNADNIQRGCKIGNLTCEHGIMTDVVLRAPVKKLFSIVCGALEKVFEQGVRDGEFMADLNPRDASYMVFSLVQGGYVCSKGLKSDSPYHQSAKCLLHILKATR